MTSDVSALVEQVARSAGDLPSAISLPPRSYTSPEFYEFERDAVFGDSWLYLCHVSEVASPGDVLPITVAGEPLVVTRDQSGEIHVLSSLCRHRSYPVIAEPANTRSLRCPYHYWSYGLDGRLQNAPSMDPAHRLADLKATYCLPSFPVEIWQGFVFTHLGDDPEPLWPTLERLAPEFAAHRTSEMVVGGGLVLKDQPWNWKNMMENALEAYHTSFIHRGYHENAPARLVEFLDFDPDTENGIMRYAPFLQEDGGFLQEDGKAAFPVIDGLTKEQRSRVVYAAVPPTMFVSMKPDSMMVFRITPDAHDRLTHSVTWLFPPATVQMPEFDELMAKLRGFFDVINGQDAEANANMFAGLSARNAARGPFSPQEATLPQLNGWLLRRYRAALRKADR
ncbi:aromatic ring-hydroxylating oxygenase subunit alpha [Cryptosporangium phraense]|uniref:Aromatic ring-hydroxylating dioxygenase subunit alpha n=1 Tax=Cryptosporangium phraense TaxID=2593070 RepID=A0A545APD9_9ACTN|nr:aromatic ring-hydroxylating dioxygenase subunit alpha [Cryptosporangium phraense]TQS43187.1 aromatic ring-hydroxylating dioxygenase subunit alpha [Cryptosporangium phraense]